MKTAGSLRTLEPLTGGARREVAQAWRHRAAWVYFVRSFMRRRYGRTFLGYLWIFLPVVVPLLMGALVFGGILGVSAGPVPYFLFFIVASGAWHTFAATALLATRSLEMSRSELRRVYVPRLIPLSASLTLPAINLVLYAAIAGVAVAFYWFDRHEFFLSFGAATLLVPVALALLAPFRAGLRVVVLPARRACT